MDEKDFHIFSSFFRFKRNLGEEYCKMRKIEGESEVRDFLIGTLFPDVRYIAHFSRELTHPQILNLQEITKAKTFFERGIQFHAWVDYIREEFVVASGIYEKVIPYADGHQATLLKFIEEEILGGFYDGQRWSSYFNDILQEEKVFTSEEVISKWHTMIRYTMSYRPSWLIWGVSYFKESAFGISNETLYNWSYLLPQFAKDPEFQAYVQELLHHIFQKMDESLYID